MIQKNDLIVLLTELEESGIDVGDNIKKTALSREMPTEVIKFINNNRQIDISAFYEKLRNSYNNKKSNLYINLVKETIEPIETITTLSSLALQINLFSKHLENKTMFFKHSRIEEILSVLLDYYDSYDFASAISLLSLIKADLKCFEMIK